MKIEQIYTACLSQASYYIESNGESVIIDPLRDVSSYINRSKLNEAKIKYIFETHFHADFVSGHLTLSKLTNAPIIYGPNATPNFDSIIAYDGQVFQVGDISITVIHTPGHTMESSCFLLKDKSLKDYALFTGDTLFIGDVGRPDLAQIQGKISTKDLSYLLYNSLRKKILPLSNDLLIYPGHGSGSACGKNLSKKTLDTLGNQKKSNYALREDMTKVEFYNELTKDLLPPPNYFPSNVDLNKNGYNDVSNILKFSNKAIPVFEFISLMNDKNTLVLDVRSQFEYEKGHIPNSINIGLNGNLAPLAGLLITNINQPILLLCPLNSEKETIIRLARVGFDNVTGYLKGGFETWFKSGQLCDQICSISTLEFFKNKAKHEVKIFDVRNQNEYNLEHVKEAINIPLDIIKNHINDFPKYDIFYIYCAAGYRSIIASSILKRNGIHNFINIKGGLKSIKKFNSLINN
jgi:glyoxylase-like metal-dependent hydrolase (beta-lactamase superfamily II)/rhodanese-related sulfurtransferase